MINGVRGIDEETGLPKYEWLNIPPDIMDRVQEGSFEFDIEVGSFQKVDISVVRKAFENMFNILARTEVVAIMQAQGDDVKLAEALRKYIDLFPELGIDASRLIQRIGSGGGNQVLNSLVEKRGGLTNGSNNNALERQLAERSPTIDQQINNAQ